MAKKPQKSPRSSKPTRAKRQATRKKDKKGKGSERQPAPSLKAGARGGKGAPEVSQEPQRPKNSRPRPKAEKEREGR